MCGSRTGRVHKRDFLQLPGPDPVFRSGDSAFLVGESGKLGPSRLAGFELIKMASRTRSREGRSRSRSPRASFSKEEMAATLSDTIQKAFGGFKTQMEQVIDDKIKQLETAFDAKLAAFTARHGAQVEVLNNRVAYLERQLDVQDRTARANNLIIFGLPEDTAQPERNLQAKVTELFPGSSPTTSAATLEVRRLGRPREGAGIKPRPVLAKFVSNSAKHAALQHSKTLRARRIYLDTDMTPAQQRVRTAGRDRFAALKAAGEKPFWREERLFCYRDGRPHEVTGLPPPPPPPAGPAPMQTYASAVSAGTRPAGPAPPIAPSGASA